MKKSVIIWIVVASLLIFSGCILFVVAMSFAGWNFSLLSTAETEINEYEITEPYNTISVKSVTSDVVFLPSRDNKTSVICREYKNANHSVEVKNNTLTIEIRDTRKWYEHINIVDINSPEIIVYIPESECSSLFVELTTGDVELREIKFDKIKIHLTTGDVELYECDACEIEIKTTTGDVEGSLLSGKNFIASTTTGDVEIPRSTDGGECKITTTTGDIEITVKALR